MYICMYNVHVRTCMYACMHVHVYVCMYLCMLYVCMYVHVYVCMYVCMYVRVYCSQIHILKRIGGLPETCHMCRLLDVDSLKTLCALHKLDVPPCLDLLLNNSNMKGRKSEVYLSIYLSSYLSIYLSS